MKRSIIGIIFVLVCCVTLVGNSYAVSYGGHDYLLTATAKTWLNAEAEAVAVGGHLVTINDSTEEAWLQSQFGNSGKWIGFTDQAAEGTWVWISGEPVTYTNWNGGEPNDAGGEDYAVTNWSGIKWNDLNGAQSYYGIIEIANGGPIPTPEPATMLLLGLGLIGLAGVRRKFKK
jgi:hypothetical protein